MSKTSALVSASLSLLLLLSVTGCSSVTDSAASKCEELLKDELVSPTSAKFSGESVHYLDNETFAIYGDVDSDNKLGASLRASFICEGKKSDDMRIVYLSQP
jgi:hypothetical protein